MVCFSSIKSISSLKHKIINYNYFVFTCVSMVNMPLGGELFM